MVESFYKQDEKTWLYTIVGGVEDKLFLQSLQVEIALENVYQKVEWEIDDANLHVSGPL